MKKFILGLVMGAILFVPITASAWNRKQMARPIYGADCQNPEEFSKKYPDEYKLDGNDFNCSVTIYSFDDSGNKCYLAKGSNGTGLSCVKR